MTGPAKSHREARPIGNYRTAPWATVDAVHVRSRTYDHITVMADPATGDVYVFGPYDQKASLFELRHPDWNVGIYNRRCAYTQIAGDLRSHLRVPA